MEKIKKIIESSIIPTDELIFFSNQMIQAYDSHDLRPVIMVPSSARSARQLNAERRPARTPCLRSCLED
jgi:hypothetical protein